MNVAFDIAAAVGPAWSPATAGGRQSTVQLISEHWHESLIPVGSAIAAGAALLIVLLTAWLWTRWQHRHEHPRPWRVFHQTAAHMGLTWRERWLLICIARHEKLPSPLTLMLSRRTLWRHARHYVQARTGRRRTAVVQRVAVIREALFDLPPHHVRSERKT
ncbi:MAG: hypothetical protein WD118_00045 [Phycisphaeraceae bacterium]